MYYLIYYLTYLTADVSLAVLSESMLIAPSSSPSIPWFWRIGKRNENNCKQENTTSKYSQGTQNLFSHSDSKVWIVFYSYYGSYMNVMSTHARNWTLMNYGTYSPLRVYIMPKTQHALIFLFFATGVVCWASIRL